jgi:hypothetical protein
LPDVNRLPIRCARLLDPAKTGLDTTNARMVSLPERLDMDDSSEASEICAVEREQATNAVSSIAATTLASCT